MTSNSSYLCGTAHESVVLDLSGQGLEEFLLFVVMGQKFSFLQLNGLRDAAGKVDQGIRQDSSVQRFVIAMESEEQNTFGSCR